LKELQGASATFLADKGATHCFLDKTFATINVFKQTKTHSEVHLANGSVQASTAESLVHIKIQGHSTYAPCFIIDMQQQFDVILGDT
jgi:hypothetical protein